MALRPLTVDDLDVILPWRNAPTVRLSMFTQHMIPHEEHHAWFERISIDETSQWLIFEETAEPVGVVYFTSIHPKWKTAFWGFYPTTDPPVGIGRRIEWHAVEYAFEALALHKLSCEVLASNQLVINQHKRFGFTEEGRFREHVFTGDKYQDVIRFAMLASEWQRIKALPQSASETQSRRLGARRTAE